LRASAEGSHAEINAAGVAVEPVRRERHPVWQQEQLWRTGMETVAAVEAEQGKPELPPARQGEHVARRRMEPSSGAREHGRVRRLVQQARGDIDEGSDEAVGGGGRVQAPATVRVLGRGEVAEDQPPPPGVACPLHDPVRDDHLGGDHWAPDDLALPIARLPLQAEQARSGAMVIESATVPVRRQRDFDRALSHGCVPALRRLHRRVRQAPARQDAAAISQR